MKVHPPIPGYM